MTAPPPDPRVLALSPDPVDVGRARRFVGEVLADWGRLELGDVATLLVSELVTNVVLHAGTVGELVVRRTGPAVRVEVHDRAPALPRPRAHRPASTTGRGLGLLDDLAGAWGVVTEEGGKQVWFEVGAGRAAHVAR